MKRGAVVILALLLAGLARADDAIQEGRALLGGPGHERGVRLIRERIGELEELPPTAERLHSIGLGYFYLEEDAKAKAAFEEAIRRKPGEARHHFMLGILLKYSDLAAAEKAMGEAVRLEPRDPGSHFELGAIRARAGKTAAALESFKTACELDPKAAQPHVQMAHTLSLSERSEEALAWFEKAIALDPRNADVLYDAGQVSYNLERFAKAYELWSKAAELTPDDLQVHKKLVQACYALGKYEQAEPHRRRLFALRNADGGRRREIKEFCFDQFDVGENRVFAYETFDKKGALYYVYTFKVLSPEGDILRTVNIESSSVTRELGVPYVLGEDEKGEHRTYYGFRKLPPYPELKKHILKVIRRELVPGASSGKGR